MLETILKGKWMMIPLVVCSIFALGVFIDRLMAFRANNKIDNRSLRSKLMALLRQHKMRDAAVLCINTPGPISSVLLAGLQSFMKLQKRTPENTRMTVGQAMEDNSFHSLSAVSRRLWILAMIGTAAPLLGMTGTVTGMIASFAELSSGTVDTARVSLGISEALITTAAGLMIALAAVIPYGIFTSMADKIELEIEEASTELVDLLATEVASEQENAGS